MNVLDIGTGESTLPFYLAQKVKKITCLDIKNPSPKYLARSKIYSNLQYRIANMLSLPFGDNSFDLVLSISSIEHLANDRVDRPYNNFLNDVKDSLRELVRVLKPGGFLYLTSDLYFPKFQLSDRYGMIHHFKGIGTAFRVKDFQATFIKTITSSGCKLPAKTNFNFMDTIKDVSRSTYRGRYFTTFAIYAQKN